MQKFPFSNCTIVAVMILLVGCETDRRETAIDADIAAIKTVSAQLVDAYMARDWDAFAGFFTDDAIWMPPGVAPLQGKDAWWAWVEPWWTDSTIVHMNVSSEEIVVADDWAIERHIERQDTIFGAGGETTSFYFKGIWILRRQEDGSWRIARYIWNENVPAEGR